MVVLDISEDKLKEIEQNVSSELRKCYGAFSSLQNQLHHINGCIEEIHSYMQVMESAFNDMNKTLEKYWRV